MKIIYRQDGAWVWISGAPGFDLPELAPFFVPNGLNWEIVEDDDPRLAPAIIEQPGRLYKSTLIRRLNEQENEPEILKALLDAAPLKNRMLWNASEWIGKNDPLFTTLEAAIGGALGAERAAQILAPEA